MIEQLYECEAGQVVKVWMRVPSAMPVEADSGEVMIELETLGGGNGGRLLLSPSLLVEQVAAEEPWPGALARASLAATAEAFEAAYYGEDEEGAGR